MFPINIQPDLNTGNFDLLESDCSLWTAENRFSLIGKKLLRRFVSEVNFNGYIPTKFGRGATWSRVTNAGIDFGVVQQLNNSNALTILVVAAPVASATNRKTLYSQRTSAGNANAYQLAVNTNAAFSPETGNIMLFCRDTSANNTVVLDTSSSVDGLLHCWVLGNSTIASSGYIYRDGLALSPSTNQALNGGTYFTTDQRTRIGNGADYSVDGAFVCDDPIYLIITWPRLLSVEDAQRLSLLFSKEIRQAYESQTIWVELAAGTTYDLLIDPTSFALTNSNISLLVDRLLSLDSQSFSLTNQPINFNVNRLLSLDSVNFNLTNSDITFVPEKLLNISSASFSLTNQPITFTAEKQLSIDTANFNINTSNISLLAQRSFSLDPNSYILTLLPINFIPEKLLSINSDSLIITTNNIEFNTERVLNINSASFNLLMQDIIFNVAGIFPIDPVNFNLTNSNINFVIDRLLSLDSQSFSLTNQPINFNVNRLLSLDSVNFNLTNQPITFTVERSFGIDNTSLVLNFNDISFSAEYVLNINSASFNLTFNDLLFVTSYVYPPPSSVRYGFVYGPDGAYITGTFLGFNTVEITTNKNITRLTERVSLME